jgi:hypothetical protein
MIGGRFMGGIRGGIRIMGFRGGSEWVGVMGTPSKSPTEVVGHLWVGRR